MCNNITSQASCDSTSGCYWATWTDDMYTTSRCDEIPETNLDCVCTLEECGNSGGPSGCEPTEFCFYKNGLCRVMRTVPLSDDLCVEDGDYTMQCVPSAYCQVRLGAPTSSLTFLDSDCVARNGTTSFPTNAPTSATGDRTTPWPTRAPTVTESGEITVPAIAGTVGGICFVLFAAFAAFFIRKWKTIDEPEQILTSPAYRLSRIGQQHDRDEDSDGDSTFPDSFPGV